MTELFVLTLLAVIVAVYGTLPRHRQLRVGYSLVDRKPIFVLSILCSAIILTYIGNILLQPTEITSLGVVSSRFFVVNLNQVNLDLVQLWGVIGIVFVFAVTFARDSVRIRNEDVLLSNLRRLYNREEYSTLVDVLRENHSPLISHPEKPTDPQEISIADLMREALEEPDGESENPYLDRLDENNEWESTEESDDSVNQDTEDVESNLEKARSTARGYAEALFNKARSKYQRGRFKIEQLRYYFSETAEEANEYTEFLLLNPKFASEYPVFDPRLGIDIINDDSIERMDREKAVHLFLETLLESENSLLYREVERVSKKGGSEGYDISSENQLLHSMLSDCNRAKNLNVYRPIGNTSQYILDEHHQREDDYYTRRELISSTSSENAKYGDPLFVAISFFDIMVQNAFSQEMVWHMWLYYYDSLTERICRNFKIGERADPSDDYPNDYSRLLADMTDNMIRWLDSLEKVDRTDDYDLSDSTSDEHPEFIQLESIDADRGANIPKGTAICLISCHQRILTTDEIPHRFKSLLTRRVFGKMAELRSYEEGSLLWKYSQLLLHCVEYENERANDDEYYDEIKDVFCREMQNDLRIKKAGGDKLVSDILDLVY